jgi:tetratricopeptide (TPR) repeat protein
VLTRQLGDDRLLIESLSALFFAYYHAGQPDGGLHLGEEAVERARQLGDDVLLARSLMGYLLASDPVDPARYTQLFTEAIACTERSGDRFINCQLHNNAACHALNVGDIPAARAHLQQAAQVVQAIGGSSYHVPGNLGWVLRQEGDPDGARSMFEAALRISRRNGELAGLAYASLGLACLAADLGDWRRAGQLHGAAQALLDRTGQRWEPGEARSRQDSLDQVRAHLGQEQFDRVYAHGTTLSLEEAVDVALAEHRL